MEDVKEILKTGNVDTIVKVANKDPETKKKIITFVEEKSDEAKQILGETKFNMLKVRLAESLGVFTEMAKEKPPFEMLLEDVKGSTPFLKKPVAEQVLNEKKLSFKEKARLPKSAFALPKTKFTKREKEIPGGSKGKYPIHDRAHAQNALARAKQQLKKGNLSREEYNKIVKKVCAKYPDFPTCQERKK